MKRDLLYMEDITETALDATDLITNQLLNKGLELSSDEEDAVLDSIMLALDKYASDYRHHN